MQLAIVEAAQTLFEKALNAEKIVLSRAERELLWRDTMKTVLTEMLSKLDETQ
jgi:hypothetical protein